MKRAFACNVAAALLIVTIAVVPAAAQRMAAGRGGNFDELAALKNALQRAGAAALTAAQEASIKDLIANFRSSHKPVAPDPALAAARTAYENAILAGRLNDALAQARIIADHTAANSAARLQALANFAVGVAQVLDAAQLNALVAKFGAAPTVRMIESLAGGPRMGLGPGRGAGPAMMGARP